MKRKAMDPSLSSDWRSPTPTSPPARAAALYSVDILETIFLNLPPHQVVCLCRLVCHQWKEVADLQSIWKTRCRREGYHLCDSYKIPEDWRLFYFLCKMRKNLIKNPRGEEGMNAWAILRNGGDGWIAVPTDRKHPDETVRTNFVTSFTMCVKSQIINLEMEGYNPSFMDHFQPTIRISDWFASRFDCGSQYNICVELLNDRMGLVQRFTPDTIYVSAGAHRHWNQITHVFQNYGPGVRYIRFTHGGKDTRYWKGHYGIHLTDSCVEICPAIHKTATCFGRTAFANDENDGKRKTKSRACAIS